MRAPLYVIGDIHGRLAALEQALEWIARDGGPDARVVFVGDYTDRGPDSRAVIDLLLAAHAAGRDWHPIKGNHDRMFEWFLRDEPRFDPHLFAELSWLHPRLGGLETLASYGVEIGGRPRLGDLHSAARALVPAAHRAFLAQLPLQYEAEGLLIVHAGIRPGVALAAQSETDRLWIRQPFVEHLGAHPKLIVHGHTAIDRPAHYGNRINLDGGAGYGRPIFPAVQDAGGWWLLGPAGREALSPPET